jgi:hypothetical protein
MISKKILVENMTPLRWLCRMQGQMKSVQQPIRPATPPHHWNHTTLIPKSFYRLIQVMSWWIAMIKE